MSKDPQTPTGREPADTQSFGPALGAGHTLPERSRSHASTTASATTIAAKHGTPYHAGVPAL